MKISLLHIAVTLCLYLGLCLAFKAETIAQSVLETPQDTAKPVKEQQTNEVVVTATRTERLLLETPIPITIIDRKQIEASGTVRLNELLQLQTGMTIVNDHGVGIQMQGFSPEYTLILLDGEPLIGRTAGTLDLTRFTVQNIARIEIIKGPASSLYGSEALGGVINIITEDPKEGKQLRAKVRYGSNNTLDASATALMRRGKHFGTVFLNRYSTSGYTLRPESGTPSVAPYDAYTIQGKYGYDFTENTKLTISGRAYLLNQYNYYPLINNSGQQDVVNDDVLGREYNLNPILTSKLNKNWKITSRLYSSVFNNTNNVYYRSNGEQYFKNFFNQTFNRLEQVAEFHKSHRNHVTMGGGILHESVHASRYDGVKEFMSGYGYVQDEWYPCDWANFIVGARYDAHSVYGTQLSPKLAVQVRANERWRFNASAGRGFKAPDFRQLYLNFENLLVGYSVFGTQSVVDRVQSLQDRGLISTILTDAKTIAALRPERSISFNAGTVYSYGKVKRVALNAFHHTISDMIIDYPMAIKTNSQPVYSYLNQDEVVLRGVEIDAEAEVYGGISVSGGYQFLDTYDRATLDKVKEGKVFYRARGADGFGETRVLDRSDYKGLLNRSAHMASLRVRYENKKHGFDVFYSMTLRSKFGLYDNNGNGVFDNFDTPVKGFSLHNINAGKQLNKQFRVQAGIDNVLGYTDKVNMAMIPGRLWFVALNWQLSAD